MPQAHEVCIAINFRADLEKTTTIMGMSILVYTCSAEAPGVNRDFFKLHALGLEYDAIIFYDTDVCLCGIIRTRSAIVDGLLWLISLLVMKAGPETLASTWESMVRSVLQEIL